jgi:hypothetical protein
MNLPGKGGGQTMRSIHPGGWQGLAKVAGGSKSGRGGWQGATLKRREQGIAGNAGLFRNTERLG